MNNLELSEIIFIVRIYNLVGHAIFVFKINVCIFDSAIDSLENSLNLS